MKSLSTLIDLKQKELDEKRRILVQIENELDRLKSEEQKLKEELSKEAALATSQPSIARYFADFSEGNRKLQEESRNKQDTMNSLAEAQRETIRSAFADLKQIEIAKENIDNEELAVANRKENLELDEIGLRNFTQDQNS